MLKEVTCVSNLEAPSHTAMNLYGLVVMGDSSTIFVKAGLGRYFNKHCNMLVVILLRHARLCNCILSDSHSLH